MILMCEAIIFNFILLAYSGLYSKTANNRQRNTPDGYNGWSLNHHIDKIVHAFRQGFRGRNVIKCFNEREGFERN